MRNVLLFMFCVLIASCKAPKTIVEKEVEYVDRVEWRDTTIYVPVPIERVVNVVPMLDTLFMETSVSRAKAWVDTTSMSLNGELENKSNETIKYKTKWKERVITLQKTNVVYKDKIVYRTPKWFKKTISLLSVGLFLFICIKYRKTLFKVLEWILKIIR